MLALFTATAALYAAATLFFLGFLVGMPERVLPWARRSLAAGFVVHFLELGSRGIAGLHPVSSVREAVGFLAWVAVGVYLYIERKRTLDAVGAIVSPAALILLLAARLTPAEAGDSSMATMGVIGRVHILLASIGISVFAIAAASAVLYLLEARQLRRRKMTAIVKKGAALETLDRIAHRCVEIGFPIFTVALIAGVIWSAQMSVSIRPEHIIAGVSWVAFAVVLFARVTAGWRGLRAAAITLFGFTATLVVLTFYFMRAVV